MNKYIKNLIALSLTMSTLTAFADKAKEDESRSPLGCRDQGYVFKLNVLKVLPQAEGDKQSLFFIYNKLNKPINMYQMLGDASTESTYLNHVINSKQWAVLATSEPELNYICAIDSSASSHGKIVDCAESVKVCEYARVKFGLNNRGNYWFVNSNSRNGAVRDVTNYGIIPR
jgi:hypothetical protein